MQEPPNVFNLDRYLAYQLSVLSERIGREFADVYRERFAISRAEWRVLVFAHHEGAWDLDRLHMKIHLDEAIALAAIQKLEKDGRISVTKSAGDTSLQRVDLTASGCDLLSKLAPVAQEVEDRILGQLGAEAPHFKASLETLLRTTWQNDIPLQSTFHNVTPTDKGGDSND